MFYPNLTIGDAGVKTIIQALQKIKDVLPLESLIKKFKSFNWKIEAEPLVIKLNKDC